MSTDIESPDLYQNCCHHRRKSLQNHCRLGSGNPHITTIGLLPKQARPNNHSYATLQNGMRTRENLDEKRASGTEHAGIPFVLAMTGMVDAAECQSS
jgi:hypothetical protein